MSAIGTQVTLVALQFVVLDLLAGSATEVGWVTSARWLPYLLFGLVVGALVDRARRRPTMIASDLVRFGVLGVLAVLGLSGTLDLPTLLVLVMVLGAAGLVNDAASMAFVPRLVPGSRLQHAHSRIDTSDAVAQVGGPALAGVLIRTLGAPVALLADAVSYLFSAAVAVSLRDVPDPSPARERARLSGDILEGLRWVYRTSGLAKVAIATHVWFVAQALLMVALVPFAVLGLELSAAQVGVALAVGGAGAVVGASVTTWVGRRLGTIGTIATCYVLSAVGALVVASAALAPAKWGAVGLVALGQALHGMAMGASNSHEMSFRQLLTPDHLQARTNTFLRSANRGVLVVMAPMAGVVADRLGFVVALAAAGVVFAVAAALLPKVRRSGSTSGRLEHD